MNTICETLTSTALFHGWNPDAFDEYSHHAKIRQVWKGEILVHEGEPCAGIGLIIKGNLAVQKYTRAGNFSTLELLKSGSIFGEDLIFSNKKNYANTIEALTNSKVVFISREALLAMLSKSPKIMQNFLSILSEHVTFQNRRIYLLSQKRLRQRIAYFLLECLHDQIERDDRPQSAKGRKSNTHVVELPASKEVVSNLLAMPRPSFSRELINMARDGIIRMNGRMIWLLDLDRLEKVVVEGFADEMAPVARC
jgi:CRP/FNR family transcriptional regulator, dissimilatory nitrate respiration regulator